MKQIVNMESASDVVSALNKSSLTLYQYAEWLQSRFQFLKNFDIQNQDDDLSFDFLKIISLEKALCIAVYFIDGKIGARLDEVTFKDKKGIFSQGFTCETIIEPELTFCAEELFNQILENGLKPFVKTQLEIAQRYEKLIQ